MQHEIAGASVLGFIPTAYPAGVILAEEWRDHRIVKFTALVDDVERTDYVSHVEDLPSGADLQWSLIERGSR